MDTQLSRVYHGDTLNKTDPASTGKDPWADVIASAAAHVKSETAPGDGSGRPRRPGRGRKPLLVLAGVVMTAVVAFGVRGVAVGPPTALTPTDQAADLRLEASALIEQIEAYRTERGELPDPSLLSPFLDEGYEYHVINAQAQRYIVRRTAGGVTVSYDGSLPLGLWLVIGGGSSGGQE